MHGKIQQREYSSSHCSTEKGATQGPHDNSAQRTSLQTRKALEPLREHYQSESADANGSLARLHCCTKGRNAHHAHSPRGERRWGGEVRRAELTSAAIQGAGFHVSLGPGQEMLTL